MSDLNAGTFNQAAQNQLQQAVSTLSTGQIHQPLSGAATTAVAAPTPMAAHQQSFQQYNPSTAKPIASTPNQRPVRSTRQARGSTLGPGTPGPASASPAPSAPPATTYAQSQYVQPQYSQPAPALRSLLVPTKQAMYSTYASRLRTGATLLMQPILAGPSGTGAGANTVVPSVAPRAGRRGAQVSYVEPGSEDDEPEAGEVDSADSDFVASGGVRQSIRAAAGVTGRSSSKVAGSGGIRGAAASPAPVGKAGLDQSYLGMIPPARFTQFKHAVPTKHEFFEQDQVDAHAIKPTSLVPIRVEFETETHRVRDCFVWNVHETLLTPDAFARVFCADLDLPATPWVDTVAAQIRTQLEEHEGVASMDFGIDYRWMDVGMDPEGVDAEGPVDEIPECRVIVAIDVQIGTHHLIDHIEWDLLSPLTPESFASQLCAELGLAGEAAPLIAHAVHEELVKHKRDAVEWGVLGVAGAAGADADGTESILKDKTGLGIGWGKAAKDGKGRGPKTLKSVWRDWVEAEEFSTRFEVLTAEEVERREMERERASRRLRRETSKFQSSTRTRRPR